MTLIPIAEPRICASGFLLVLRMIFQSAFLPSLVMKPKLGVLPKIAPNISRIPELRLHLAPKTELAKTTAEDSLQERISPFLGVFPISFK